MIGDVYSTYRVALSAPLEAKIPAGDPRWPAFNRSFRNLELEQAPIAESIQRGCPITTQHSNHWRTSANYLAGQHLGLDFDTETEKSTIPYLLKDHFIARHAAFIYTTPTHRPDAPRARALFLLDTPIMQAHNYCLASAALLWMFGSADRQCKDACRFFYGGRPGACELEWLGNELPLGLLRDLITRYQATGLQQRKHMARTYPEHGADMNRVVDALRHVDAWAIDYTEWVCVLMALHAEFGDAGLGIAESWADGKAGEVSAKWKSFHDGGNVSGRVGIGTVFAMARDRGWQTTA